MTWTKTRFPAQHAANFEADGLRWLARADGGVRVAQVVSVGPGRLELERIASGPAAPDAAADFGAALARTHAAGAPYFGFIPGDTPGYMGQAPLPPAPGPAEATGWGEFYAHHRVLPFLRRAVEQGRIGSDGARVVERVAERLIAGDLDHDQPGLVQGAARLHGDLWNGNVLWDADDDGTAVLIDPTAHGGHAETDLAMLDLFGLAHLETVLTGYQEVSALAPGWQERVSLHQLNPLLVHTVLFGGGYAEAAVSAAQPYA